MDELMSWDRRSGPPSLRTRVRNDNIMCVIGGEKILLLFKGPIKSLKNPGGQLTAELSDKEG